MKMLKMPVVAAVAALSLVTIASSAGAFVPRSPQVAFASASLQNYLNSVGESINVATDQLDGEVWASSVSGHAAFTLMMELSAAAPANAIGVYNINDPVPALFQVFPPVAGPGWYAVASFSGGNLVVSLFDNNSTYLGQSFYAGVNANAFGFYLQGPGGLFFSDDARNGGLPQELTYAGTGQNFGDWWQCFEDSPYIATASDFDDAILLLQSVVPIANEDATWGGVKNLYR
jgi:hypothetical protein